MRGRWNGIPENKNTTRNTIFHTNVRFRHSDSHRPSSSFQLNTPLLLILYILHTFVFVFLLFSSFALHSPRLLLIIISRHPRTMEGGFLRSSFLSHIHRTLFIEWARREISPHHLLFNFLKTRHAHTRTRLEHLCLSAGITLGISHYCGN